MAPSTSRSTRSRTTRGPTTIEALWLGVPVVSLKDRPSVGRFGASILGAVGLADWVAESTEAYVALAAARAADLAALVKLRSGLRARFAASPLADAQGLAHQLHAALHSLWAKWCAGEASRADATRVMPGLVPGIQPSASARASGTLDPGHKARDDIRGAIAAQAAKLQAAGRVAEAAALCVEHLSRHATDVEAHAHLSDYQRLLGRLVETEATARKGLALDPRAAAATNALGNALSAQARLLEAEAAFTSAIESNPQYAEARNNRALALMRRGQFSAAEADLRAAMALRPDLVEMGFNLASTLQDQGRVGEAVEVFRATVAKSPRHATGHGMMLFALTYHPELTGEQVLAEYRRWNEAHAKPHAPRNPAWPNDRAAAGACASAMSRPTSPTSPPGTSSSRCWRGTTGQRSRCSATRR